MSSHTDMETLSAKVHRLEVLFEAQQRESAAKPKHRTAQPEVSTGSSEPALQAEISRLQEVIAAKDAIIVKRDQTMSVLLEQMAGHEGILAELVRDIHRRRETAAAQDDDRPQREVTPKVSVTETDNSHNSVSTSPTMEIIINTEEHAESKDECHKGYGSAITGV